MSGEQPTNNSCRTTRHSTSFGGGTAAHTTIRCPSCHNGGLPEDKTRRRQLDKVRLLDSVRRPWEEVPIPCTSGCLCPRTGRAFHSLSTPRATEPTAIKTFRR